MRQRFGWTISDFNMYAATNIILQVFGNIIGIYILSKLLGVSEIVLAIIGYGSAMTEYIFVGCAVYPWQLYAGMYTSNKRLSKFNCFDLVVSVRFNHKNSQNHIEMRRKKKKSTNAQKSLRHFFPQKKYRISFRLFFVYFKF